MQVRQVERAQLGLMQRQQGSPGKGGQLQVLERALQRAGVDARAEVQEHRARLQGRSCTLQLRTGHGLLEDFHRKAIAGEQPCAEPQARVEASVTVFGKQNRWAL